LRASDDSKRSKNRQGGGFRRGCHPERGEEGEKRKVLVCDASCSKKEGGGEGSAARGGKGHDRKNIPISPRLGDALSRSKKNAKRREGVGANTAQALRLKEGRDSENDYLGRKKKETGLGEKNHGSRKEKII